MGFDFHLHYGWSAMQARYGTLNHRITKKWEKRFVLSDPFLAYLPPLVGQLRRVADNHQLYLPDVAISFVQSLPHVERGAYQAYAIETLIDMAGDCSDKAQLMSALLDYMSLDYITLTTRTHQFLGVRGQPTARDAYRVSRGATYLMLEMNAGLLPVGRMSADLRSRGSYSNPKVRHPAPIRSIKAPPRPVPTRRSPRQRDIPSGPRFDR